MKQTLDACPLNLMNVQILRDGFEVERKLPPPRLREIFGQTAIFSFLLHHYYIEKGGKTNITLQDLLTVPNWNKNGEK